MTEAPARALPRRLLAAAAVAVVLAAVGARAVWSIDRARAGAPFAPTDPGVVAQAFVPVGAPGSAPAGRTGTFAYRPGTWHTLIELRGLPEPGPGRRTLVFARYAGGWVLIGGAVPGPQGAAEIDYRADPPGWDLYELIVTEGVDTAEANPHGRPLLRWVRPDLARFNRQPWPIELVR